MASNNPLFLIIAVFVGMFSGAEIALAAEEDHSEASADGRNLPPVLGNVGRNGAYGYSQSVGSGISFSSSKTLAEEKMKEGLAEFRTGKDVVWLYYTAEASDPEGDEVRYIWSQLSPEEPVAIIEQDDSFVPSGQAVDVSVCTPPSGAEITLQVVAMDRNGARSEPRSVIVNADGCASEALWVRLSRFAELREAANRGDHKSQRDLALAYISGDGVFRNVKKGTELMRTHAEAGNAEAQAQWAYFLDTGKHRIKKDKKKALEWYRAAARQGHAHAQYAVGFYEKDKREAARWYKLAAEQNNTSAQFSLAKMLAEGDGVPRDLAAAKAWMTKSADQGYKRARTWIANWEVATAFDASGNRLPQLTAVTYAGDHRPTSVSYSADKMTYKDGKWVTEGGQTKAATIVWRKFNVRAEDFDGEAIRYLVTQTSPDTPKATIGGQRNVFKFHASGKEVMFAICFPQISSGEFTFQVIAEDKRGGRSAPRTIALEAIRSDKCQ
ncbi:MAG: hypothetical protein OXU79_01285 [Gemmatimonadota bacterium]|nr:hypothetical protein [Gemmatimonadota bacterium]